MQGFQCLPTAAALIFDVVVDLFVSDASPSYPSAVPKAVKVEPAKSEPQEEAQVGAEQLGGDDDDDADIKGAVLKCIAAKAGYLKPAEVGEGKGHLFGGYCALLRL